jgi:Tol biopolymer transport system component/DNA-binding winged helix-turn-helix (wHTH) protein
MPVDDSRIVRYRFGSWEVIPDSLEIRKGGSRIKLREQPFRVLLALIEDPGALVTRDQLRNLLWPDDTFVDFDKGLNTAVNHLRKVLCDSPSAPRYIETVPKHGYRFIGEVSRILPAVPVKPAELKEPARGRGVERSAWKRAARTPVVIVAAAFTCISAVALMLTYDSGRRSDSAPDQTLRVRPLTSDPGFEDTPSFSPDGAQVAFARRNQDAKQADICVQTTSGSNLVEIAATSDDEFSPAWSPDGATIAYLRRRSYPDIDVMTVAPIPGQVPRRVATISYPLSLDPFPYKGGLLSWSPDSKFLVIPDAASGGQTAIWRLDVESGRKNRLTQPAPPTFHSYPVVSPDGRWLALYQKGGDYVCEVLVFALSPEGVPSGTPIRVAQGVFVVPLAWRREELLIISRSSTRWSVLRWNPRSRHSGSLDIPELSVQTLWLQAGTVSRDGRKLAIARTKVDTDIWQVELSDTGEAVRSAQLIASNYSEMCLDWSRDGQHIVFKSTRSGSHEAWIADADGSHVRQLTRTAMLGAPYLSPDGKEIVFNRGEGGNEDIYVASVETGTPRRLIDNPAEDKNARWSRDGANIYFDSDRTGRPEIWKISRLGGEPLQVTHNGGANPFESPDGRYVYYGRDRHVWRMPLNGGPEERLFESLISWTSLAMGSRHMYFVRGDAGIAGYGTEIYSYDLASGSIRKVIDTGKPVVTLAASPDEHRVIYGRRTQSDSDLMLVEFPP